MAREPKRGTPSPRADDNPWRSDEYTFPSPGPKPKLRMARNRRDRDRMISDFDNWETRELIYKAVHTNDPRSREFLAQVVDAVLCSRRLVDKPHIDWLSWVLRRLIETNQVPHMARGNTVKTRQRNILIDRIADVMLQLPPGPVTQRLRITAKFLNASYGKVRAIYYADVRPALELYMENSNDIEPINWKDTSTLK